MENSNNKIELYKGGIHTFPSAMLKQHYAMRLDAK